MNLSKRDGSPFWWVSWTDEDGTRVRVSTKESDKRAAARKGAEMFARGQQPKKQARRGALRLSEALDAYADHLTALGKASAEHAIHLSKKTTGRLKDGKRFHLDGGMWLTGLTSADLEKLLVSRVKEGNGLQTAAHELKNIRAAVMRAKGLKLPVPDIDDWRIPKLEQKTRYLTTEEWQVVFNRLDPDRQLSMTRGGKTVMMSTHPEIRARMADVQDLFVALTMCGGRWSEVTRLTWSRIDWERRSIQLWGSKGGSKERLVPLPEELSAVMQRRYEAKPKDTDLIFPGRRLKGIVTQRSRSTATINRAMQDCGLNPPEKVKTSGKATTHSLRHTFASWLVQRGAPIQWVQEALGHADMKMTMRYAHLQQQDTVTKLNALLGA